MALYPVDFETDVVLADGATAHVRPIRPEDGDALVEFHGRQSPQSIYYRYFSPRPRLSERDVERLTNVDHVDRFALLALRADQIIGVARYDRPRGSAEAEVAFFVDDANHGRGLATLMLEHLAARAREVGIRAFTATVLPENRKMIGVFTAAGFEAATRFADGVIEVRLGLQPTPEAEAAIETRARGAAAEAVRRLLSPGSVALVGASRRPGTVGHDVLVNLQRAGFDGPVYAVNPNTNHVGSVATVPSVLDIEGEVDLAIIAVPAPAVAEVIEQCGRRDVYGAVILSSGFAEAGEAGAALEADVLRAARSWGVRILGPNCLGAINTDPAVRLHATFARVSPREGRVALLSESGMVGAAIVAQAADLGIGISSFVALGNRADVSGNDLLQYWEGDDRTDVICMYIESFGNPRHFSRQARHVSRVKPIVALKSGRRPTELPSELVAANDEALLRQTGVIRVPTLTDLLQTTRLLISQPLPAGRGVAVVGNAGGSLAIAADAVLEAGLSLVDLGAGTRERLEPLATHPVDELGLVDLGLQASGPTFADAVAALASDPIIDSVLVLYAPSLGASPDETRAALESAQKANPTVPVVACFYGPRQVASADGRGVPVYDAVEMAARALGRAASYGEWLSQPEGTVPELEADRAVTVRHLVADLLGRGLTDLDAPEVLALLDAAGVTPLATEAVTSLDAALRAADSIGYPVVLKAAGRDRMAKTAAAGFAIDLEHPEALRAAWERMGERFEDDELVPALVQPMVPPGVDVSITVSHHPQVGPILTLGPGGAASALDTHADVRVLPLTDLDSERLVAACRMASLLDDDGKQALRDVLLRVGALVEGVREIDELALNPVIITAGQAVVTQGSGRVAPVVTDARPPVRRV